MHRNINKPIFVLGSPRSGTSILTWCLGHHPNLFPLPESNWMGDFAVNVAVAYQIGAARGDYSVLSAMDIQDDELFAAFGHSINDVILRHRKHLETKRETRSVELKIESLWLEATSTSAGPKGRWVDGTPEYSFHIWGLRKLFPQALFIHLLRDVQAVVHSMVNFHRMAGIHLVANEEEAYQYWIRTVSACLQAEQALGPSVVYRVRYADLLDNPESTMRSLFDFLGEPYAAKCLEPLKHRINSSDVPGDFKSADPAPDPAVVRKAVLLSAEVEENPQPAEVSSAAAAEMETAFRGRVKYMATIDSAYQKVRRIIEMSNKSGSALPPAMETVSPIADPSATVLSRQP
jgi:hypothetical protein